MNSKTCLRTPNNVESTYEVYYSVDDNIQDVEHDFVKAVSGQKAIRKIQRKYDHHKIHILYIKRKE